MPAHPRLLSRLPRTMFVWSPRSHTWRLAQLGGANPPVGSEAFSGPTPGLWLLSHHPPLCPHHLRSCRNAAVPGTPSQLSSETLFSEPWHPTPDPPSQEISREKQNPNGGTFSYCITRCQEWNTHPTTHQQSEPGWVTCVFRASVSPSVKRG